MGTLAYKTYNPNWDRDKCMPLDATPSSPNLYPTLYSVADELVGEVTVIFSILIASEWALNNQLSYAQYVW